MLHPRALTRIKVPCVARRYESTDMTKESVPIGALMSLSWIDVLAAKPMIWIFRPLHSMMWRIQRWGDDGKLGLVQLGTSFAWKKQ